MENLDFQKILQEGKDKILSVSISTVREIVLDSVHKELIDIDEKRACNFDWDRVVSRSIMNAYAKGVYDGIRLYDSELNKVQ